MRILEQTLHAIGVFLTLTSCTTSKQLQSALQSNPDIVFELIEKYPEKFALAVQKASADIQRASAKTASLGEEKRIEAELSNPKKPALSPNRASIGPSSAPITVVMYSDFQCPYCAKGHEHVEELLKEYEGKVHFVYKHLPLEFHPLAMPAAQRFEAIALQNREKAMRFQKALYEDQSKLASEKFLDETAKILGVDVPQMKKDMNSPTVKNIIEADMKEAKNFGFTGTPAFLVNGVKFSGAVPIAQFKPAIEKSLHQVSGD